MSHFRESVHNNKHGILSISSPMQTKHKIHANIFPWVIWNWKGCIKTKRLSFGLSFATCRASVGEAIDITKHLGPKVVLGEHSKCFVAYKVSHESASMSLSQKEQTKRSDAEHPMDITMSRAHLGSDTCNIYFAHTKVLSELHG